MDSTATTLCGKAYSRYWWDSHFFYAASIGCFPELFLPDLLSL